MRSGQRVEILPAGQRPFGSILFESAADIGYNVHMGKRIERKRPAKREQERWTRIGRDSICPPGRRRRYLCGPGNMNGAMNGDLVQIDLLRNIYGKKIKRGLSTRYLKGAAKRSSVRFRGIKVRFCYTGGSKES